MLTRRGVLPLQLVQFLGIVLSCSRPSSLPACLRRISRPFSLSSSDPNLLSVFTQICTFCVTPCNILPGTFESSTQRRERERSFASFLKRQGILLLVGPLSSSVVDRRYLRMTLYLITQGQSTTREFSLNLLPRILLLRDCFFYTILQELLKNPNGRAQQYLHAPDVSLLEEMLMQMKKMLTNNCVCVCLSTFVFHFFVFTSPPALIMLTSTHQNVYVCERERERERKAGNVKQKIILLNPPPLQ